MDTYNIKRKDVSKLNIGGFARLGFGMGTIVCVLEIESVKNVNCKLELMYTCSMFRPCNCLCSRGFHHLSGSHGTKPQKILLYVLHWYDTWCVHPFNVALTQQEKESTLR